LDRLESYLEKKTQPREFVYFLEVFVKRLPGMLERFESRLKTLYEGGEIHFTNLPYQLQGRSGYKHLLERVVKLKVLYLSSIE
jgi:hypothetical protein